MRPSVLGTFVGPPLFVRVTLGCLLFPFLVNGVSAPTRLLVPRFRLNPFPEIVVSTPIPLLAVEVVMKRLEIVPRCYRLVNRCKVPTLRPPALQATHAILPMALMPLKRLPVLVPTTPVPKDLPLFRTLPTLRPSRPTPLVILPARRVPRRRVVLSNLVLPAWKHRQVVRLAIVLTC